MYVEPVVEDESEKQAGIGTGAFIGIILGGITFLLLVILAVICCLKRNKTEEERDPINIAKVQPEEGQNNRDFKNNQQ